MQKLKKSEDQIIFVIGNGRSGTHLLGHTLQMHNDIDVSMEERKIFNLVRKMAVNPSVRKDLFPKLVNLYQEKLINRNGRFYADKSHPNIWLAEDLAAIFPNAKFLAIERNPYAAIASMLMHKGVSRWCEQWEKYPIPNYFLGVTSENKDKYEQYSITERCALRWLSHKERLDTLMKKELINLHVLSYEEMVIKPKKKADEITMFLNLPTPIPKPKVKKESLLKWNENLTEKDKNEIEEITGVSPEEWTF
ncbi:sulfotransferase family protein [Evansella tamaricis]|uniref:Sulfotransferase n=1 Tax=Evansella tamaricis TaxID=2069301 RepID=A0ABS6JI66_9BACI|nr:sulfotransferase [Evansella tamaricis]MBU9713323.1 sulfotransferase [Evansella tamaricis]